VQQKVEVTVMEVDVARKRIALSMKTNDVQAKPVAKKKEGPKPESKEEDMQSKLKQLKNMFR
jgi:uncharacterized protein